MSNIFTTTYEIVGEGTAVADAWYAAVKDARTAQMALAEELGGTGFRPDSSGGMRSILFDALPRHWIKIGTHRNKIEARPRLQTKIGANYRDRMAACPRSPLVDKLAADFGYNPPEMAIDRTKGLIYFPTEIRLTLPTQRIFLRLPRFNGDGFEPDVTRLIAIPESELMTAIDAHNVAVLQRESSEVANG